MTTEPAPEPLQNAYYVYDGDGNLVKATINGKPTYFLGKLYQKKIDGTEVTIQKYYSSGSAQVAVRTIEGTNDTLQWLLSDHLGSTSTTANADGTWNSTIQYTAFGEIRANSGITGTDFRYTGQLRQAELGLYYYVARWYDPALGHFTQADTIVPNASDSAAYDRYAYVKNNPVKYNDPSGHMYSCGGICGGDTRPYLSWAQGTGQISYSAYNVRLASVRSREASTYAYTSRYKPQYIPQNNQKKSIPAKFLQMPEYKIHDNSKPNGFSHHQATEKMVNGNPLRPINITPSISQPMGLGQFVATQQMLINRPDIPSPDYHSFSISTNPIGFAGALDNFGNIYLGFAIGPSLPLNASLAKGYIDRSGNEPLTASQIEKELYGPSINFSAGLIAGFSKSLTSSAYEEGIFTPGLGPSFQLLFYKIKGAE